MKYAGILFFMSVSTLFAAGRLNAETTRVAVVELFTSEGCNSCPSSETALSSVIADSARQNLPLIVLEWHVDYWDYLGWKDPFATAFATQRQNVYASALPSQVYTPQAIVNGSYIVPYAGSTSDLRNGIAHAMATNLKEQLTLTLSSPKLNESRLNGKVTVKNSQPGTRYLAALVESGLSSKPNAGENNGVRLEHSLVVRSAQAIDPSDMSFKIDVPRGAALSRSKIVILAQRPDTMEIVGAVQQEVASVISSIEGRLVDGTGKPIASLPVQACSGTLCILATTNAEGYFRFPDLEPATYVIKSGVSAKEIDVKLGLGQNAALGTLVSR